MSVRDDNARALAARLAARPGTVTETVPGAGRLSGRWRDYVIADRDAVLSPCNRHGMEPWIRGRGPKYPVVFDMSTSPPTVTTSCGCRPADVIAALDLLPTWAALSE